MPYSKEHLYLSLYKSGVYKCSFTFLPLDAFHFAAAFSAAFFTLAADPPTAPPQAAVARPVIQSPPPLSLRNVATPETKNERLLHDFKPRLLVPSCILMCRKTQQYQGFVGIGGQQMTQLKPCEKTSFRFFLRTVLEQNQSTVAEKPAVTK